MQPDPSEIKALKLAGMIVVGLLLAIQIFVFGVTFAKAPGYIGPFLSNPGCITAMLVVYGWEALGFAFVLQSSSIGALILRGVLAFVFCFFPALMVPQLGPAILTIAQAMR